MKSKKPILLLSVLLPKKYKNIFDYYENLKDGNLQNPLKNIAIL